MKKLWLIFAQAVTVCVAALFVVSTFKPQWVQIGGLGGSQTSTLPAVANAVLPALDAPRTNIATAPIASFAEAARKSSSAVVNIYTKQKRKAATGINDPFYRFFFGDKAPRQKEDGSSLGSGVIVAANGGEATVLTNNHVIEGADAIEVVLSDARRVQATVMGTDPETDLAVLKIKIINAPVIEWGNLADVRVGDAVLAVGNPFGVGQTVTQGIVSALGRNHLGINTFENFIQTDAAINPGNSGGALTDSNGRLIGINTAIYSRDGGSLGIGFAIPVSTARTVMEQLISKGSITRGYLAVGPEDLSPELRSEFKIADDVQGCLILNVQANGPAAKAGIQKGDVVQTINGTAIKDRSDLLNAVAGATPNQNAAITVWRAGKTLSLTATIGTRPKRQQQAQEE